MPKLQRTWCSRRSKEVPLVAPRNQYPPIILKKGREPCNRGFAGCTTSVFLYSRTDDVPVLANFSPYLRHTRTRARCVFCFVMSGSCSRPQFLFPRIAIRTIRTRPKSDHRRSSNTASIVSPHDWTLSWFVVVVVV